MSTSKTFNVIKFLILVIFFFLFFFFDEEILNLDVFKSNVE